ncbi:hypothetical protein ACFSTD_21415 [Novosphingobium colocasiae]
MGVVAKTRDAVDKAGAVAVTRGPVAEAGDELEMLRRRVAQLEKINAVLIDRVERSSDIQGSAFFDVRDGDLARIDGP